MKPKENRAGNPNTSSKMDQCQTPPYAVEPLIPYIKTHWTVWEPAYGEGHLSKALSARSPGFDVFGTDLLSGTNFFDANPDGWDAIITNPPYSIKYQWLKRCFDIGKPFALLVPLEMLGAERAASLFRTHHVEIILMNPRIDFKMPNALWSKSSAQFPTCWLTWGFDIGQQLTFARVNKPSKKELLRWDMKGPDYGTQKPTAGPAASQQAFPSIPQRS